MIADDEEGASSPMKQRKCHSGEDGIALTDLPRLGDEGYRQTWSRVVDRRWAMSAVF